MSEPPPRGAERDLFRDTWVRYLGERGAGGQRPYTTCLGKQGLPDAGQGPGEGGRILVLIQPGKRLGSERVLNLLKVTQLWYSQPCPRGFCWSDSQVEAAAQVGGWNQVIGSPSVACLAQACGVRASGLSSWLLPGSEPVSSSAKRDERRVSLIGW